MRGSAERSAVFRVMWYVAAFVHVSLMCVVLCVVLLR